MFDSFLGILFEFKQRKYYAAAGAFIARTRIAEEKNRFLTKFSSGI